MSRNRFALDDVLANLPTANKAESSQYERSTTLSDKYVELDFTNLNKSHIGAYVRYYDAAGNLAPGGWKIKEIDNTGILLHNYASKIKKYFKKRVKYSDISKLYKYHDPDRKIITKDSAITTLQQPNTQTNDGEKDIISQIGDKMLFNDTEVLKQKIEMLDGEIQRIDSDVKKIFIMVKKVYLAVFKPPGN